MKTGFKVFSILVILAFLAVALPIGLVKADTYNIVTPASPDWGFINDNGTTGDWVTGFETGPGTPPTGIGSATIELNSAGAGIVLATQKYQGVLLSAITTLSYSTYTNLSPTAMTFQINYDPDLTSGAPDPWYGRLIYEPYMNGAVTNGTWQTWDMINAGNAIWWASPNANSTVDEACPQGDPCTLTELLTAFPNIGIRNDAPSAIMFKAGSNWNGFAGNIDNLVFSTAGNTDTYDFEPLTIVYVDDNWSAVAPGTDPDGAGPAQKFGFDSFVTLQEGIAAVATGGTVYVAAGTYTETGQIVISKNISVIGENKDTTIIKPSGATGSADDTRGWFLVNTGVEFNLSNLTLDGTGQNIHTAIRTHGTGLIDNVNITNIKYSKYVGIGIYAYAGTTVSNSTLTNIERIGLYANTEAGASGHPVFTGNTYIGKGLGDWLDYGIEVENGASATITNNNISNCTGVASSDGSTSAGIYATTYFAPGTSATITGNILTNNYVGIGVGYFPTDSTTVVATNNQFSGNTYAISTTSTTTSVSASANWYGSISGPATGQIDGLVTYSPWCGDSACSFLVYGVLPGFTIQSAINAATPGSTVYVPAGTYDEDVNINKTLSLIGAGAGSTTIRGVIGGTDGATVRISANNVTVDGFTITRSGNNLTDWDNPGLNFAGIAIQGATTGSVIQNNTISGNRTAIDINNSSGHSILNNAITDNRTGLLFRNQTDNMTVTGNDITNNWTVGILFLDASSGTNVPVQSSLNSHFNDNNISGNWYGQVVDRQTGVSLPLPGTTNLKNFVENWWGTTTPVVSTANSVEPGYSILIPEAYGGTSEAPVGQPDILGTASANIVWVPLCADVTCSSMIYPPIHNTSKDTYYFTIQAAIVDANANDSITVAAGTYPEVGQIVIDKNLTIIGADKATTIITPTQDTGASGDARGWFLVQSGVTFNLSNVTLDGAGKLINIGIISRGSGTIENNILKNIGYNPSGPTYAGRGIAVYDANMTIKDNLLQNIGRIGIYMYGTGVTAGVIDGNTYEGKGDGDWLDYGIEIEGGAVVEVKNNVISDCLGVASVDGSGSAGLLITTYFAGGSTANIHDNTFSNNSVGVYVGYDETDTSSVIAQQNRFIGNEYGLVSTNPTVAADHNYWGTNALGLIEAQIDGNVTFEPYWLDYPMSILSGTLVTPVFVDDDYAAMIDCGTLICGYDAFATVEDGVAAVSAGGVVNVAAGTYNPPATIALNKALSILGPTTGEAIVQGAGGAIVKVFEISESNVTIQNLTITLATAPTNYDGLINVPDKAISNINILDNEIYVASQPGAMSTWWARAVQIGRYVTGSTVSGNTMYNTRSGLVIGYSSSFTIADNVIYNTKGGIMNYTGSAADAAARVMTNNSWNDIHNEWDIVWNSGGGPYDLDEHALVLLMSQANNDAYVVSQVPTEYPLPPLPAQLIYGNRSHVFVNVATGTTTIKNDNGNMNVPYAKIQDGINAVVPGGKVFVAAGTYPEMNILINKSLTLLGDPGDAAAGPGVNAPVVDGGSAYGDAFKLANGVSNVTISGFEVKGYATGSTYNGVGNAISAWVGSTSNITIQDNYFHDLEYNAILVGNDYNSDPAKWGDHTNWLVTKNITDNCGYIGFELTNTSNSIISDNIIHLDTPFIGAIFSSARRSESGLTISNNYIDGTPSTTYPVIYVYAYDGDMANPNLDGVLIEGNTINTTGIPNQIYIRNIGTGTVTGVQIEDNKLNSLKNLTGETIDASPNWWGTINKATILSKISGDVVWEPFWLDEGMTTLSGPVPTVYVDDDYTSTECGGHLCGYDAFSSIQDAIAGVDVAGTVHVAAGTYTEDLSIDKALSLIGPNASINPNTGIRAAEAVIHPSSSYPNPDECTVMAYLSTSDITIKGFTFDGDNPAMNSGVMINGADVNACEILAGYEGMGNIVVENNILKHSTYSGIDFYNYTNSTATSGNYIRYNLFQDIGETTYNWGIGVLVYNNFYADITDNVFDSVRLGVQTGNFFNANPGTTGSISDNVFNVWRLGIFHNLWYSNASTITISGNTINAVAYPGATKWNGILVSSIGGTVNTIISDNDIVIPDTITFPAPGYSAGYNVWNTTTTAPLTISGGSVTGGDHGVFVNNYEGYTSNANNTSIILTEIEIDGAAIAGISIWDSPLNTNGATVTAELHRNVITNSTQGVLVTGTDATATGRHNQIISNTLSVKNEVPVALDLEENWWGSALKTDFEAQIDGSVDYNPWCGNPECTTLVYEVTPGFTIQGAIDLASAGDTINVAAGTYPEHITIDKALTLTGANNATTIINGGGTGVVAQITADNVILQGFTIQGSGTTDPQTQAGLTLAGAGNCTITDNIFTNNMNGIAMVASSGNTISNNTVTANMAIGIALADLAGYPASTGNIISGNTVTANGAAGIYAGQDINNNQYLTNTITGNSDGLYLWKSSYNTVTGNTITGNSQYGIHLMGSSNNNIADNLISTNLEGIMVRTSAWPEGAYPSAPNTIFHNQITSNTNYGLDVDSKLVTYIAEANWWGAITGPAAGKVTSNVDYIQWCGDSGCTFLMPLLPLQPTGTLTTWDGYFRWTGTSRASFYMVQVYNSSNTLIFNQYFNTTICSGVNCAVKPTALGTLANGSYSWNLKEYNSSTGWGAPISTSFTLNIPTGTPIPGMPIGTLNSWDKSFNWSQVNGATFHFLEVKDSTGTVIFGTHYNLTFCNGSTCKVFPPALANLANGTYTWRVRAYGSTGWGPYSSPTTFTLLIPSGATVVLNSPAGSLTEWDRYFRWTGITGSTYYLVEVYDASNVRIFSQWVNLTNCSGLECALKPAALETLANGSYSWRMRDYSQTGYGPYTAYKPFVLNIP